MHYRTAQHASAVPGNEKDCPLICYSTVREAASYGRKVERTWYALDTVLHDPQYKHSVTGLGDAKLAKLNL